MVAVEAGEVESDGDKGALDMAAVTFIERQAPRQPPTPLSPKNYICVRVRPPGGERGLFSCAVNA